MTGMGNGQFQFSVRGMFWAILWISMGLATYPAFDAVHFLDDDPNNVSPRMLAASWLVLATGVIGSFFGRPVKWAIDQRADHLDSRLPVDPPGGDPAGVAVAA
jgi:hypothetical protein